ncbi:MAG TPA: serine/threonine-protein kinase [Myxococcaceae bacterium]|nr:serine/threonine-protein kinase [Myxococcaceae bacterium]
MPVTLGKYLLLDRINVGGMAEVWRGKMFGAAGFERTVALKRILPNIAEDEEFIAMFKDEAKITVQLNHANIAQVYEFDEVAISAGAPSYYIAMEYVSGRDLRAIFDRCRKKGEPVPVQLACFVVSKLCEGLDYAHRKKDSAGRDMNVVHRDVSPQNVLISFEGEIKIIDFGIAKAAGKVSKTQAGIIKGKFAYMSPEQIRGQPLDRRSDVFAIGVCLWELLAGERLFVADSDFAVLEKVRKAEVVPPSTYNRRVPPALDRIVLKALAKEADDRFQYASDLGDELQRFLLTQDAIFSRKDLMQYMRSTFAEDVEREKLRLQEYAQVKPPEGVLSSVDRNRSAAPVPLVAANGSARGVGAARPSGAPGSGPPVLGTVAVVNGSGEDSGDESVNGATLVFDRNAARRVGKPASPAPAPTAPPALVPARVVPVLAGAPANSPVSPATVREPPRLTPVATPIPEATPLGASKRTRWDWIALFLLVVGGGVGAWTFRDRLQSVLATGPATVAEGVLYIDVPEALRGAARVNLDGRDLGPVGSLVWPIAQRTPVGSRTVIISAPGWKTFTRRVEVKGAGAVTEIRAEMQREVETAHLVLGLDPAEAEVRIDGRVVKKEGDPAAPYLGEVVVGKASTIEVRMRGYKPFTRDVTAAGASEPVRLTAELEPAGFSLRVTSVPPGAKIRVAGRSMGETPAEIQVPPGTTELVLAKKCFDVLVVPVKLPNEPGKRVDVTGTLKRRPRCR